ncbi:MAG: acyl-CoA thioesterase [Clostridia bacterium]|nr:acyl-CoA thioesterase [Clostridia bacterium]
MPGDVNSSFRLFGGLLMQWIDVVAAVVARRHADREVLTAAVDHLSFLKPASLNDIVTLCGRVTYVGNTSMEICVETFVERPERNKQRALVNRAYLTMVALDEDGQPTRVPRLLLETEKEKADFAAGERRKQNRKRDLES